MILLRLAYAAGLLLLVAYPILLPFGELLDPRVWAWSDDDIARLLLLSKNTLALCAGTIAIALPLGTMLGVLLFRTEYPGRRVALLLVFVSLFVPLPVIVSAWQAMLGTNGWLPMTWWSSEFARPWATGMAAAIWIHAMAATPWVALIVGVGLTRVEPEREDEAALEVGPWRVLLFTTLPRARASVLAATLFVALQTASEISVADMMLVRTLAEVLHLEFTEGRVAAMARTLVVFLPILLATWAMVLFLLARLERTLPPLVSPTRAPRELSLGVEPMRCAISAVALVLLGLPLFALFWKVGLTGYPPEWDGATALRFLRAEAMLFSGHLPRSIGTGLLTGMLIAMLGLVGCWLARESTWFRLFYFSVLTWAWVLPAPIVGIDVHRIVLQVKSAWPDGMLAEMLYHGPSPLPLVWVQGIRTLPIAALLLWPVVRLMPRELFDDARLAGAGALGEFAHLVWPLTWRATFGASFVASALCLGEVAASVRAETPGWSSFTTLLFERMHYGVENSLAALSLLMLASVGAVVFLAVIIRNVSRWIFKS